jgi:Uma2 family endonuclease
MAERRCGTCKWWKKAEGYRFGDCEWADGVYPDWIVEVDSMPSNSMFGDEGKECQTWQPIKQTT